MKRLRYVLALLLVLVIMIGVSAPALAGLFADYGYMRRWTSTQWADASQWTVDQWQNYYDERLALLDDPATSSVARQNEDGDVVFFKTMATDEQRRMYETSYTRYAQTMKPVWIRQEKVAMGCPYPDGINVKLNDSFLTFADVRPQTVNDRTMVPFRAIFEALGATVSFDEATATAAAVAADGTQVSLTLRKTQLKRIDPAGATTIVAMDVAPYLDPELDRILVPARFVSEALGYEVGWDETHQIVYLYDAQSLIASIDSQLEMLNQVLTQYVSYRTGAYQQSLSLNLGTASYQERPEILVYFPRALGIHGTLLKDGENRSLDLRLISDLRELRSLLSKPTFVTLADQSPDWVQKAFDCLTDELPAWVEKSGNTSTNILYGADENEFYVKSETFAGLTGWPDSSDSWLHLDASSLGKNTLALQQLLQAVQPVEGMTVGSLLGSLARSLPEADAYAILKQMGDVAVFLYGDDQFEEKDGDYNTKWYTSSMDEQELADRAVALGMVEEEQAQQLLQAFEQSAFRHLTVETTFAKQQGSIVTFRQEIGVRLKGDPSFDLTMRVQSDSYMDEVAVGRNVSGSLVLSGDTTGALSLGWSDAAKALSEPVPTAPPEGDTVVDADSFYKYDLKGLIE